MSHGRQRGGKWGVNFISSFGPQHSLSTVDDHMSQKRGQGNYKSPSGLSSTLYPKSGGASVPPPPSLSYYGSSYGQKEYSYSSDYLLPSPNTLGANETSLSSSNRAFVNLGRKRVADEDE